MINSLMNPGLPESPYCPDQCADQDYNPELWSQSDTNSTSVHSTWIGRDVACLSENYTFFEFGNDGLDFSVNDHQVQVMLSDELFQDIRMDILPDVPIFHDGGESMQPCISEEENLLSRVSHVLENSTVKDEKKIDEFHCQELKRIGNKIDNTQDRRSVYSRTAETPLIVFLRKQLADPGNVNVKWKNPKKQIFQILQPTGLAKAWGVERRRAHYGWQNMRCTLNQAEKGFKLRNVTPFESSRGECRRTYRGGWRNTKHTFRGKETVKVIREYQIISKPAKVKSLVRPEPLKSLNNDNELNFQHDPKVHGDKTGVSIRGGVVELKSVV